MKKENKFITGLRITATGLAFFTFLAHEGISASLTRGNEGKKKRIGRKIIINRGKFFVKTALGLSTTELSQKIDTLEEEYYEMSKKINPELYNQEYTNNQYENEKQKRFR